MRLLGKDRSELVLFVIIGLLLASFLATISGTRAGIWAASALIALGAVLAVFAVLVLRREASRRREVVDEHSRGQDSKIAEMEQFAGRVAHDIRSPLAAATLAADMLEEQLRAPELHGVVARLQRSLRRAATITDGLLEFARAGASREPGARANVSEVIEDIADGLKPELESSAVQLEVENIPSVYVSCSTGVLLSLVGNLLRNAIKYMGKREERHIAIRAVDRQGAIRVEVRDTGPGVAAEMVPRLFEPYFRVAKDRQVGLGLGLPTVRKLAEGHGGRVGVESVFGHGSTFWFELPYAGGA